MSNAHALPHNPVGRLTRDHPGVVKFGRAGWFAKGVVYLVAGVLALSIAAKASGWSNAATAPNKEASPTGALKTIAQMSGGALMMIFFVIYQQVENGMIYPWLMARKVRVNPLPVLLSVLLAVELFGIVGALLAVPVSGAIQVVVMATRQNHSRVQLVLPDSMLDEPEPSTPRNSPDPLDPVGRRALRHSGKPSSRRRAWRPRRRRSWTASSANTQYGPRQ